jgi:hypothetical protein
MRFVNDFSKKGGNPENNTRMKVLKENECPTGIVNPSTIYSKKEV